MAVYVNINRDSSKDIISKPERLYAYTNQNPSGETLYAWTVLDTDTINPATYKTIYTSTPTIETGAQATMDNVYVLVNGKLVNVSSSDIVSINGTGAALSVTASNNEYIEISVEFEFLITNGITPSKSFLETKFRIFTSF